MSRMFFSFALRAVTAILTIVSTVGVASAVENIVVDFRLTQWRSAHLHDASQAAAFEKALRELGCETARDQHGDHIDLNYRCPQWRRVMTKSHEEAHRWQDWLNDKGFETRHQH